MWEPETWLQVEREATVRRGLAWLQDKGPMLPWHPKFIIFYLNSFMEV